MDKACKDCRWWYPYMRDIDELDSHPDAFGDRGTCHSADRWQVDFIGCVE